MTAKQKDERSEPYLRKDLTAEEHERLTAELKSNPESLRALLQIKSPEDEELSSALLFDESDEPEQSRLDDRMRRYLLRDPAFGDEEIARLEELMLEDERYFERLSLVEGELIEDYLRGALAADDRQRFKDYFLITPERREKLNFVEAMASSAAGQKAGNRAAVGERASVKSAAFSHWQSLLASLRPSNLFAGAALAGVLLFFAASALIWLSRTAQRRDSLLTNAPPNESTQTPNRSLDSNRSADASETEDLAAATPTPTNSVSPQPVKSTPSNQGRNQGEILKPTPSASPAPIVKPTANAPRSVVFALFAPASRGAGGVEKRKIEPGVEVVVLRLPLDGEGEYEDYRVVVENSDGEEVARLEKLKATEKNKLRNVSAALPAASFTKSDEYTVILSGKTKGAYEEVASYPFSVLK